MSRFTCSTTWNRLRIYGVLLPGLGVLHAGPLGAQTMGMGQPLQRHYKDGETVTYKMDGVNEGHLRTIRYTAYADGVVSKLPGKEFVEQFGWSGVTVNGGAMTLSPASQAFRQDLSLAPEYVLTVPDLSKIQPILIGPVTDLLTFYVDAQLAARQTTLLRAGDHVYIEHGIPTSWADGSYVVMGQDAIDFDITLKSIDRATQVATVVVRHVPPPAMKIKMPAAWMNAPVGDAPNNWVEVEKVADGKYTAEIGKETFEAVIRLSIPSGRILSATMDNPVEVLAQDCTDVALTVCGTPSRYAIHRKITLEEDRAAEDSAVPLKNSK